MAASNNQRHKCRREGGEVGTLIHCRGVKQCGCYGDSQTAPTNSEHTVGVWPRTSTPRKMKVHIHMQTCTAMLTAVRFLRATRWEQNRCPPTGEVCPEWTARKAWGGPQWTDTQHDRSWGRHVMDRSQSHMDQVLWCTDRKCTERKWLRDRCCWVHVSWVDCG